MRAVFINHCHPDMPHICALRMRKFAHAFATMGHQVVLLTESLGDKPGSVSAENVSEEFDQHDWSKPYYLSIKPIPDQTLANIRVGKLGWINRKAVIAWRYVFENGLYGDWRNGAAPYLEPLSNTFQPDIIWASFGNTSVWNIAQDLSKRAGCPWVADIKDNWQNFIPIGLRKLIASRFKSAAHMTSFSESHLAEANQWFMQNKTAIYSGFDDAVLRAKDVSKNKVYEVLLTGSIYDEEDFQAFINGLAQWLENRAQKNPVRFIYAGNDHQRVRNGMQKLSGLCDIEIKDFMKIEDLLVAQRRADINTYIRLLSRFHFHHKAIELMAAKKPILCFPTEVDETIEIIKRTSCVLYSCGSVADVVQGFEAAYRNQVKQKNNSNLTEYSWQGQAKILEKILEDAKVSS